MAAIRRPIGDGAFFSGDFLPGGSPTVPPTARQTSPAGIAPNLFEAPTDSASPPPIAPPPVAPQPQRAVARMPRAEWPGMDNGDGTYAPPDPPPYINTDPIRVNDPLATTAPTPTLPTSGRTMDDSIILSYIRQWAGLPQADPTLTNDPGYYLRRIKEEGGLGTDNEEFWRNASSGPSAFYLHPEREAGNGGGGQSQLGAGVEQGLLDIFKNGGLSPSGIALQTYIDTLLKGGHSPNIDRQLISARDDAALAEQGQLADARAELADRGLISTPGSPQGAESAAIRRVHENIAPSYARAVTDIETHAMDLDTQNLTAALSAATGLSTDAAHNLVQAASVGTNRESSLASIALQQLDQNRQWQQFLMTHDLDSQRLQFDIENGDWSRVLQLINDFLQSAGISAGGHVG